MNAEPVAGPPDFAAPELGLLPPLELATPPTPRALAALLGHFREPKEPLYALLDAARHPLVLKLLRTSGEEYQSLYEGPDAELLAEFCPYLVELRRSGPFLERLAAAAWGNSFGVILTSDRPFRDVRRHFRQFLLVKTEDGEQLYFRYYDPRVLRTFLSAATPAEVARFFGPIRSFLVEAPDGAALLRYRAFRDGARCETLPLGQ